MCWMGWDQSKEAFSDELKQYIRKINIIEDMNRLSKAVKMRDVKNLSYNINIIFILEMLAQLQNSEFSIKDF